MLSLLHETREPAGTPPDPERAVLAALDWGSRPGPGGLARIGKSTSSSSVSTPKVALPIPSARWFAPSVLRLAGVSRLSCGPFRIFRV